MTRDDEYWQRALAAFGYAKLAANEEGRASWLRIAQGFMALYRQRQSGEEERYDSSGTNDLHLDEPVSSSRAFVN
jgi:hypothetical protein